MNAGAESDRIDRSLWAYAVGLLLLCFICGGDSAKFNVGMMAAQLLAIPLLLAAVVRCHLRGRLVSARWGILAALLIVAVPLLQLLPLPVGLWTSSASRAQLLQDLHTVGVEAVQTRWTLSPAATERAIYYLIPGLALFFSMLAVGRSAWRKMLAVIIVVCVANLLLAFAQVLAGQQSFLNPYPDFAPAMAGIFANRNHQADMLAVGLMLISVFILEAWKHYRENRNTGRRIVLFALIAATFVFALPLVGSRAGVIVAMVMLMGVVLSSGLPSLRTYRANRTLQVGTLLALIVFVSGLYAAVAWMQVDVDAEGSRHTLLTETLRIGNEQAPLGSGIGTFVSTFQQGASDTFLTNFYVNNAHNEYAQWWLEGGVLGVAVTLFALVIFLKTLVNLLRQRQSSATRVCGMAAMMGIGVVILHSTVDYPLRTHALMAVFAVLSGIAIAAASSGSSAESPSRIRKASR